MASGRELLARRVGSVRLRDLSDVDTSSYTDGQVPTYQASSDTFIPGSGGGGGGGYTDEQAQDAVGTILTDTATIDFTYNDTANQITADVKTNTSVQKIAARKNSTGGDVGTRRRINFIEGSNTTITITDDGVDDELDVIIASSGAVTSVGGKTGAVTLDMGDITNLDDIMVNVKDPDFGALGDGSTDDRVAIQNAIDYVYALGGGTVEIPAGTYIVSNAGAASLGALRVKTNVTLRGAGMGATIIKVKDSLGSAITGVIRTPTGEATYNALVEDLTIDGNKANNPSGSGLIIGYYCGVSPNILCTAAITRVSTTATLTCASTSGINVGDTIHIIKRSVDQTEYQGDFVVTAKTGTTLSFTVSGTPTTPSTTVNNGYPMFYKTSEALASDYDICCRRVEVKNCNDYGFDPHERTTRLKLIDCVSHDNDLDGFVADYIIDSHYDNCIAYNNARHGINVTTCSEGLQISEPICYGNGGGADGGNGIVVQRGSDHIPFPTRIIISNPRCYQNNYAGVLIALADDCEVNNPQTYLNGRQGVRIQGGSDNKVNAPYCLNNSQNTDAGYDDINVGDFSRDLTSITRSGSTATGTTTKDHAFNVGDTITVQGATETEYNGTYTVTGVPTSTTFTYTISGTPTTPATLTNADVRASYYIAQRNSVNDITSIALLTNNVRYAVKEETTYISSGNNTYSIALAYGAASGNYSIGNSTSFIGGTIGSLGVTAASVRQQLLLDYGIEVISSAVDYTLTNPVNNIIRATFTASSKVLKLPVMNASNSLQKGRRFEITNTGTNEFDIQYQDGTTIASAIPQGKTIWLEVASNATANGSFNKTYPPSGRKSRAGTTYTISQYDFNSLLTMSNASGVTVSTNVAASTFDQNFGFWLKNLGAGNVTFDPNSTETIDGASTLIIPQYGCVYIYTDGTNWFSRSWPGVFVGDSGSGGQKGLVPAPASGDAAANKYLKADGTWATVSSSGVSDGDKGDITVSSSGTVWTIDNDVVTYAKMQNVSATSRFLGRITASAGDVEELTGTQATTLLDAVVGDSGSGGTKGLVPAPASGDAGKIFKGDGTFKYHPVDLAVHAAGNSNLTLTSMPAAATFLNGDYRTKTKTDLTNFKQCRIVIQMRGTAGASGSKLIAKYATSDATTEASFSDIGTSEVSATIDVSNTITASSWIDLASSAKADVFVVVIGSGGNGSTSPTVGSIHLQFR